MINGDYSLDIYRYDPKDDKPINIDRHLVYPHFNLRDDFEEIVKHATTDNDENMKGFFDECVIIQIKPKNNHHINLDDLPVQMKWKVSEG